MEHTRTHMLSTPCYRHGDGVRTPSCALPVRMFVSPLTYVAVSLVSRHVHSHPLPSTHVQWHQSRRLEYIHACLQGEFVYELVGEALLPAPLMEFRGVVPLEGPNHTYDMCIPLANSQVRSATLWLLAWFVIVPQPHMYPQQRGFGKGGYRRVRHT